MKILSKLRMFSYVLWITFTFIYIMSVWEYFGNTLSKQIHTFGLIIQLFGLFSIVFILINKERLEKYAIVLEHTIEQGIDILLLKSLLSRDESIKSYSLKIIAKLLIFSVCNLAIYLITKNLDIENFWLFILLFGMLILYIYIWAWSYLIIIIFNLLQLKTPAALTKIFEISDYGLSLVAVIFFLLIFIVIRDITSWLAKATIMDKVALLTLPLFFLGTLLQLIAAFNL